MNTALATYLGVLSVFITVLLLWVFQPPRYAAWRLLAYVATRKRVFIWLLRRGFRTPYSHIASADGSDVYMRRYWLFNPYAIESGSRVSGGDAAPRRAWWREMLPSVRLHHIKRADQDRHLHDHPWNARTIILKGWYEEERYVDESALGQAEREMLAANPRCGNFGANHTLTHVRIAGYTGRLLFGQYHRISAVPRDGVWTLFITWRYRGTWGFDVDGYKVPWREYMALAAMSKDISELPLKVTRNPIPPE